MNTHEMLSRCQVSSKSLVLGFAGLAALFATQAAVAVDRAVPGAYPTIQAAMTAAVNGDRIVLANGTYTGASNRNVDFGAKRVMVVSASGNPALCIIDCQDQGRAFSISGGQDASSGVSGVTIRDGNAFATAQNEGGGIYVGYFNATSCTITNCIFESCRADKGGGIILDTGGSHPIVSNCLFKQNTVIAYGGGIISDHELAATIVNCVFDGNSSTGGFGPGGGLSIFGGAGVVRNCTFTNNSATFGSALSMQFDSTVVTNCIMWNNVNGPLNQENGTSSVRFCDISNTGLPTSPDANGNFNADPRFVNAAAGNFRLQATSPCINRGSTTGVTTPPFPGVGSTPVDFDRNARICGPAVDLGAFETGGCTVPPPCPCDWNGDGRLTSQDFFDFISSFFAGSADFNHSGTTTSQDFFDFIACLFASC